MDIQIDTEAGRGRRDEIYAQIRAAILAGRLRDGEALPPTRELAQRLAVSRNTVSAAYDRLTGEGFLTGRVGAGTYVRAGAGGGRRHRAQAEHAPLRPNEPWDAVPNPLGFTGHRPRYDFRAGLPDVRSVPLATLRRLLAEELRGADPVALGYGDPAGHAGLRAAVARHVGLSRGVLAGPGDVVVTTGTQQALDLIGKVLVRPGDVVAVEDPGYPPPRLLFEATGAKVTGVPVDAEGLVTSRIPPGTRLVYVTPSHQFPLGMPMSLGRRQELLSWAREHDAVLVEDDYDTEFRYTGRPLEPLHSLDGGGRVIYVGSFSKILFPTLRVGFLVAPPSVRAALVNARYLTDWSGCGPIQAALARFIEEGALARHVRRMRREYRARHELVTGILERDFAGVCVPIPSGAGLHVGAYTERNTSGLALRASRAGVGLFTLDDFAVGPGRPGLVLGYGAVTKGDIEPGLATLRTLLGPG